MSRALVVIGCGGHGREVLGIVRAVNERLPSADAWAVLGVVDDAPSPDNLKRLAALGAAHLGPTDALRHADAGTSFVVGVGDPRVRATLAARVGDRCAAAPALVHPGATVFPDAVLAEGVVVFPGARVTTNVRLGRHVHLNQNATVGHDAVLDDFATVNPLAAVSGDCHLGEASLVGTTAAVLQGRRVGRRAVVGAGACVTRDVPDDTVVKGVPAR